MSAQSIYDMVCARKGDILPYDNFESFKSDVETVKVAVDGIRGYKRLPANVAFLKMLVNAASSWAMAKFPSQTNKPRSYVYNLMKGMKGMAPDLGAFGGYFNFEEVIMKLEKQIVARQLPESAMPTHIKVLMYGAFNKLDLEGQLKVLKGINGPLNAKSLIASCARLFPDDAVSCLKRKRETDPVMKLPHKASDKHSEESVGVQLATKLGVVFDPMFFESQMFRTAFADFHLQKAMKAADAIKIVEA